VHWGPHFGFLGREVEVVRSQRRYNYSKERWWFPIMLSIVTIALYLTIRLQFAVEIECLRRSNQQGWMGHFGAKFEAEGLTDVSQILT